MKDHEKALIILNGKTITNAELNNINPESIESVSVLKDKAALALYGDKGKNGVVIVATKQKESVSDNTEITVKGDSNINKETTSGKTKIKGLDPGKQPLYIIDGKIQTGKADLNSINPEAIESINVLKGKTALDKYGDKAVNGAIEITTKAKSGEKQISFSGLMNDKNTVRLDDKIFTQVENEPLFPGGDSAWTRYLQKHINSSIPVDEGWGTGTYKIIVQFIVDKDGSISDIKTDQFPNSKTARHCIDLIKKGPKWIPAVQNGHIVRAYKKQPITFVIEKG